MNINNDNAQVSLNIYRQQSEQVARTNEQSQTNGKAAEIAPKGDQVQFSENAKIMAQARGAANEAPDVRTEKVAALREQVQNGTYKIDNNRIAEGMIKEDMSLFS